LAIALKIVCRQGEQGVQLTEIQQQAMQARMSLIAGAETYDRLFLGAEFSNVEKGILYFAKTEEVAAEIEDKFALHISIIASQIVRVPVEFVQVLPEELQDKPEEGDE
jgi:hypothetical protein